MGIQPALAPRALFLAVLCGIRWLLRALWRQALRVGRFGRFWRGLIRYSRMAGAEPVHLKDLWPCLGEWTATTRMDPGYLYQAPWAGRRILASGVREHVDVGSQIHFVTMLSCSLPVTFLDIRPLIATIRGLESRAGSVLKMPYPDGSVLSLSCLHVIEHVGLGRYGDPFDPAGSEKAARELARVLAPGGNLYISIPMGRRRVRFNAHRIHDSRQVLGWFAGLDLIEFCGVDDAGQYNEGLAPDALDLCREGCGFLHLRKPAGGRG